MSFSKTIQMFIFDGNPNGRIMCELSNWNGRVYKISRNELPEFSQRDDSENTGVYFLFGKNEENNDTVYIGEAERMFSRLKQHLKDSKYRHMPCLFDLPFVSPKFLTKMAFKSKPFSIIKFMQ